MNIDEVNRMASLTRSGEKINQQDVDVIANALIRKYDWRTEQLGYGIRITVNDGAKFASVDITTGENIESEIKRAIEAVDAHEYGDLDG